MIARSLLRVVYHMVAYTWYIHNSVRGYETMLPRDGQQCNRLAAVLLLLLLLLNACAARSNRFGRRSNAYKSYPYAPTYVQAIRYFGLGGLHK